ncbi:DNA translocase FtsK [Bacillus testis]|uniref:DNA translocase FtsK n=1 Tax=Bacillus testis TaxID=1622072 RepID=UPI000A600FFB|nr:DNA translocase FtsK [Bacillus testis]
MKWLSKVTKWFKADEVIEIEEIVLDEDEQLNLEELKNRGVKITTDSNSTYITKTNQFPKKNNKEEAIIPVERKKAVSQKQQNYYSKYQEIDAKISYQYPKGEFRFPVIPDYTVPERRKPREPRPERGHLYSERTAHVHTTHRIPSRLVKSPIEEKVHDDPPAHNGKRPFRPTEIPSPIYGFQKRPPKKVEADSEHELPPNSSKDPFPLFESRKEGRERQQGGVSSVEKDKDIPAILRKAELQPHREETQPVQERKVPFLHNEEKAEAKTLIDSSLPVKAEVISTAAVTEEQPATAMQPASVSEIGLNKGAEQNESTVTPLLKQDVNLEGEDNCNSLSLEREEEKAENNIDLAIVPEVPPAEPEEAQQEVAVAVEQVQQPIQSESPAPQEQQTGEEQLEEESAPAPKRKHIPFNVVMLRQDRESWNHKSVTAPKKAVTPAPPAEPAAVERIVSDDKPPVDEDQEFTEEPAYYQFPSVDLLHPAVENLVDDDWLDQQGFMLNETLRNFNVKASVVNITQGPAVTQFEVQPEAGVKVNKITNLTDDIKLCLAAQDIRMEAPIPGKHTIGIEIPNRTSRPVFLREIIESEAFESSESPLTVAMGLDITGAPIVTDLRKMPHGLIAGATGSGKSVCINTMLVSLLYKATPQELKVLLIDPKMVELAPYNNIPHLVSPVITDVKAATAALKWAVEEMERRYELFAHTGVRDIQRFNKKAEEHNQHSDRLPYIVIIIDELADLMMMSPAEVEEAICRIAQKARACGIHLIVATQRPSVDVITGLIKANIPTRIAFSVSSQVDSRTIIDSAGAEKLLGKGDMLFVENGSSKNVRLQGTFVSDEEIEEIVDFVKKEQKPQYLFQQEDLLSKAQISEERDELFLEACEFVVFQGGASTSSLQRRFHIGYNRAARLMDMMEESGIISEARGSKPRDVLMSKDDMQEWMELESEQA